MEVAFVEDKIRKALSILCEGKIAQEEAHRSMVVAKGQVMKTEGEIIRLLKAAGQSQVLFQGKIYKIYKTKTGLTASAGDDPPKLEIIDFDGLVLIPQSDDRSNTKPQQAQVTKE